MTSLNISTQKPLPVAVARYAEALYELASEQKCVSAVENDLLRLKAYLAGSHELRLFLASPLLRRTLVAKGLGAVLEQAELSKLTKSFFHVVALNGRGRDLPLILEGFFAILAGRRGELRAEVQSAHPLTEAQLAALRHAILKAFASQGAREVRIEAHQAPELLGGVRVQVGSFLYDGSLKGQLERMAPSLKASA